MTLDELRAELRLILTTEEQPQVDWPAVEARCLRMVERLATEPAPDYPYDTVFHFLDDPDVRQKDAQYADVQRKQLRDWLDAPVASQ
jgi:hypothetical protein